MGASGKGGTLGYFKTAINAENNGQQSVNDEKAPYFYFKMKLSSGVATQEETLFTGMPRNQPSPHCTESFKVG